MRGPLLCIIILCFGVAETSRAQGLNWQAASNWRLYDSLPQTEKFNMNSLKAYRYIDLDPEALRGFLSDVSILSTEKTQGAVWMGFYRVSCVFGDSVKILIISRYGGFFADLATKQYYQIPVSEIPDWNAYFDNKFSELHKTVSQ